MKVKVKVKDRIHYCNICEFKTMLKNDYNAHLKTRKHRKNEIKRDMILQKEIVLEQEIEIERLRKEIERLT